MAVDQLYGEAYIGEKLRSPANSCHQLDNHGTGLPSAPVEPFHEIDLRGRLRSS